MTISNGIGRVCGLALVAAAVAAPAASAGPNFRGLPDGYQPQLQARDPSAVVDGWQVRFQGRAPAAIVDGWEGLLGDQRTPLAGYRDVPDGHQPQVRGERPPLVAPAEPRAVPVRVAQGFDWADAGIGAASAFGAMLLGAGALLAARSRDRVAHP